MWSLTVPDGKPHLPKPDARRQRAEEMVFRQLGGQHDSPAPARDSAGPAGRGGSSPAPGDQAAFVRRLIAERRIEFHKVGRHVRISEAALADFIEGGRVEPLSAAVIRPRIRGAA